MGVPIVVRSVFVVVHVRIVLMTSFFMVIMPIMYVVCVMIMMRVTVVSMSSVSSTGMFNDRDSVEKPNSSAEAG